MSNRRPIDVRFAASQPICRSSSTDVYLLSGYVISKISFLKMNKWDYSIFKGIFQEDELI